eukprot:COSAG06_NODE_315_length_17722_cov_10.903535_2_plen_160_part_00
MSRLSPQQQHLLDLVRKNNELEDEVRQWKQRFESLKEQSLGMARAHSALGGEREALAQQFGQYVKQEEENVEEDMKRQVRHADLRDEKAKLADQHHAEELQKLREELEEVRNRKPSDNSRSWLSRSKRSWPRRKSSCRSCSRRLRRFATTSSRLVSSKR